MKIIVLMGLWKLILVSHAIVHNYTIILYT